MYFVACLWFKKEKAQKCASDLLTKAQSESAKRKRSLLNLQSSELARLRPIRWSTTGPAARWLLNRDTAFQLDAARLSVVLNIRFYGHHFLLIHINSMGRSTRGDSGVGLS